MSSFKYNNVYIKDYETIVGPTEKESKIYFKNTIKDFYFNEDKLEEAEIKMQNFCLNNIIKRNKLNNKINLIVGGDLSNQIAITSYNLVNKNIPFLGIYNACSTFNESLIIIANLLENNQITNALSITSSHNLNAEKQYRFPIEYGSQKYVW